MIGEHSNTPVLTFDIFQQRSMAARGCAVPAWGDELAMRLQKSLLRIRIETLEKYLVGKSDGVERVMSDLESVLNVALQNSLETVAKQKEARGARLGSMYRGAVSSGENQLRGQLDALCVATRAVKCALRSHSVMDNLHLRLISVRCRAIRDICCNETRRGKIRHLRCSKNPRFVLSIPKKLRSIMKKIKNELASAKERGVGGLDESESGLEEAVGRYYKNMDEGDSPRSVEVIRRLREACGSDDSDDIEWGRLVQRCDKDSIVAKVMETYSNSEEVVRDLGRWDSPVSDKNQDIVIEAGAKSPVAGTDMEMLDLENFQLVDVWEETATTGTGEIEPVAGNATSGSGTTGKSGSRRKRQSRFAPITDEDLAEYYLHQLDEQQLQLALATQSARTLGFCSTFVDESSVGAGTGDAGESKENKTTTVEVNVSDQSSAITDKIEIIDDNGDEIEIRDEEEQAEKEEVRQESPDTQLEERQEVPCDKGELCKAMLRKFHDSIKLVMKDVSSSAGKSRDWSRSSAVLMWSNGPVSKKKGASLKKNKAPEESAGKAVAQESYMRLKSKLDALVEDHLSNRPLSGHRHRSRSRAARISEAERAASGSPNPFEQTIEASLKKPLGSLVPISQSTPASTQPVIGRRPSRSETHSRSPERTRLRAVMLSYRRDVQKSRETGTDKRDDDTITGQSASDQTSGINNTNECGQAAPATVSPVAREKEKENTDSEGLATSSDEDGDRKHQRKKKSAKESEKADHGPGFVRETRKEKNRMQWFVPPPESVTPTLIPAPATPFLDDEGNQTWTGRKVFVVDSHDKGSSIALTVKSFLQNNGAHVYDTSNYKQAGKDLHVLVHQDWRFPDSNMNSTRVENTPISLLLLKNNSGVHFLSYTDVDTVSRFACQTVFPHGRSCIFLEHQALINTHADNIRNMLQFMIQERSSSNRIWCLKIPSSVFSDSLQSANSGKSDSSNLKEIQDLLAEYSAYYSDEGSMCLVEIQSGQEEVSLQEHVLNQQYYLQKKFRHFCILTDNLTTSELDMMFLSQYGVAVLSLNTFLINKTGQFIKNVKQ